MCTIMMHFVLLALFGKIQAAMYVSHMKISWENQKGSVTPSHPLCTSIDQSWGILHPSSRGNRSDFRLESN